MTDKLLVIDAKDAILGRLASYAAKQSLLGKKVVIVNCSEAIITGKKHQIISNYSEKRRRGGSSLKGPHFPKSPEKVIKRTIRGMLSYKQGRGLVALKNIMCFNDTPKQYLEVPKLKAGRERDIRSIKLSTLDKEL